MKKTILKSSLSVAGANLLFLSVALLNNLNIFSDGWMFGLFVITCIIALPTYFFIVADDENHDAYALTAIITEAVIAGGVYLILKTTDDFGIVRYYCAGIFSLISLFPMVSRELWLARYESYKN